MQRAVVFIDPTSYISAILLGTVAREAHQHDIQILAAIDTARAPTPPAWLHKLRRNAVRVCSTWLDPAQSGRRLRASDSRAIARRHKIPIIVPLARDINHPDFIRRIREEFRAPIGINLGGLQIFRPDLIAAFEILANIHNAPLPAYRGLRATEWELWNRERETGCTFHRIAPGVDDGPILLRDTLAIPDGIKPAQLDLAKLHHAAARVPEFLQMLHRREPGTPQTGTSAYFSKQDFLRARHIGDPAQRTAAELHHALHCFGILHLDIRGRSLPITKLEPADHRRTRNTFTTADGVRLTPTRFACLPYFLYLCYRKLRPAS